MTILLTYQLCWRPYEVQDLKPLLEKRPMKGCWRFGEAVATEDENFDLGET